MRVYYNENDPHACEWLRNLIAVRAIPEGVVDERPIQNVDPRYIIGFDQCHFFAGLGAWAYAINIAGWGGRKVWTGSAPCQPFSVAGKGAGENDPRHLWPDFFRLIRACRPPVVMGEQVSGAAGYRWFDGVAADLEGEDYACRAVDIPACAVNAPHIRQRLYWCAVADREGREQRRVWQPDTRLGPDELPSGRYSGDALGLEHAAGQRRGERRPEYELRGGRDAASSAGGEHVADAELSERRSTTKGRSYDNNRPDTGWQEAAGGREFHRAANGGDMADAASLSEREPHDDMRSESRQDARLGAGGSGGGHTQSGDMADADGLQSGCGQFGFQPLAGSDRRNAAEQERGAWSDYEWRTGADGKARRVKPGLRLLVDGSAFAVGSGGPYEGKSRAQILRGYGNAIVAPLAAEVIRAFMDAERV